MLISRVPQLNDDDDERRRAKFVLSEQLSEIDIVRQAADVGGMDGCYVVHRMLMRGAPQSQHISYGMCIQSRIPAPGHIMELDTH